MISIEKLVIRKNNLIFANVFSMLIFSPNFLTIIFPIVIAVQLIVFTCTFFYLISKSTFRLDLLTRLIFCFITFVFITALINYPRFENIESLRLAISYVFKSLNVIFLFQLVKNYRDFEMILKSFLWIMVGYALHGIIQFLVVLLGLVPEQGFVEVMGYEFVNLGWAGIYRVSMTLGSLNLVRIQSFFQEPGFLAFYLLITFIVMDCLKNRMELKHANLYSAVIFVAILLTVSLTGIALMLAYLLIKTRSIMIRLLCLGFGFLVINFIVFNDNEYISKAGSFAMRSDHYELLSETLGSWTNIIFGIGLGNDAFYSHMRVNNFIPEFVMYSSIIGFLIASMAIFISIRNTNQSNYILLILLLYALSTPMIWSPLFLFAMYVSINMARFNKKSIFY